MSAIENVAVIGAGVMGAGIAAHFANAGVPVMLLDIVPEGAANRNAIAEGAIDRMLKTDPAPLMHKRNAKRITPGNTEDHLEALAACDWIVEAVIENADIKRDLYARLEAVRKDGSIVSSNTSTIPLAKLTEGLPERFRRDFMITHFFNPPRYLRLLEVIAGVDTGDAAPEAVRAFADLRLGKTVIDCKDTPGFIANRIGTYWLQCAVGTAVEDGITVEEADLVMGRPLGIPKTGIFALLDLVGLDLMPHVRNSLAGALPESDAFHETLHDPMMIEEMIASGYTGRKGKGGFYRLDTSSGGRVKQARNLATGEYKDAAKPKLASVDAAAKGGPRALLAHGDKGGRYAWKVMGRTLAYAAELAPEIAHGIADVDAAMRLGYAWKYGPFELIDRIGPQWFRDRLAADGLPVPELLTKVGGGKFYRTENGALQCLTFDGTYADVERPSGVLLLDDVKRRGRPVARNRSASLWDVGDGVLCLEFHSKMNSLDPWSMAMIAKAIEIVPRAHKALVIYNEGSNFSVGANIGFLLVAARLRLGFAIRRLVGRGQRTFKALKYAPFPVVAAPSGMALGGGCEVLLHSDAIQAHGETYTGLVETGVGVVPAWGGCKEMLLRWFAKPGRPGGPMPPVTKVFETLGLATVARSADEAKDYLFLRPGDGVTMNRDRLLADAKAKALALAEAYAPPEETAIALPGETGALAIRMVIDGYRRTGMATPHDVVVGRALAGVLSGGKADITRPLGEDAVLDLERDALTRLACHPATIARISHTLKTGKPLRN